MNKRKSETLKKVLADAQALGIYDIGATIEGLASQLSKKPSEILKLNSNENFFIPLDFLKQTLNEVVNEVDPRLYPRDETTELKQALSQYIRASPDEIVVGTGSDQLIDVVSRMFLLSGDEALATNPTFSIYRRCVEIQGANYRTVPLKPDFSLNVESMLELVRANTKLIFLCSPNNPTGNQFSSESIQRLAEGFDGLVAVDEAYVDFSEDSIVELARKSENIIVFRTFSKVFGLAGLRVGFAITNAEFAKVMNQRFQMPYSVSIIALKTAQKLLKRMDIVETAIEDVKRERTIFINQINKINGIKAFDSQTNFVLFQVGASSTEIYDALLKKGIIIRNIGRVLQYDNCLRITVAPMPMMEKFLTTLREVLK